MAEENIYVTGIGVVSPFGVGIEKLWKGIEGGVSAVRRVDDRFDLEGIKAKIGAPVPNFISPRWLGKRRVRRLGRSTLFGLVAAREAIEWAGFSSENKTVGVVVGTGIGDMHALTNNYKRMIQRGPRRVSPFFIPQLMPNAVPAQISIEFGFEGPNFGAVSACASGAHAIAIAQELLQTGKVDAVLAGGAEAPLIELAYAGFDRLGALSTRNENPLTASRPFDRTRDGFVIGEGAGLLLMEREKDVEQRGAEPFAQLLGYGCSADAHHITAPPEDGRGARNAMEQALSSAKLKPGDVDYINAHGTSTPLNDKAETRAIKSLFGDGAKNLSVSSTKSQIGHLIGAAGGVEATVTCLALSNGFIPPTINYRHPDPECDLDYVPNEGRKDNFKVALSNSFGFGGQNSTLVLGKVE